MTDDATYQAETPLLATDEARRRLWQSLATDPAFIALLMPDEQAWPEAHVPRPEAR